tara:strand:- start:2457 stop:2780 length:324 start_codon:yes stop_codon:yes gene_type:complete
MSEHPQQSERVSVVIKVDKHETPSTTYVHNQRQSDETTAEFLERITKKYPVLRDFLNIATYEIASTFKNGRECDWSHCLTFDTVRTHCLIQPGSVIDITQNHITLHL